VRISDKQLANHLLPGWKDRPWLHVVAAALVLTALNAIKPVHIDDSLNLRYAAEFAAHPLDPYGFKYGSPYVLPANAVLVPPVLPYWLGAELALFGDHPILLKWGLLPFALALAWAVDFLAARLAPSLRVPVIWFSLLSPTVLPGFNLMMDVPMLAIGLSALAVVILSIERNSYALVLFGGLLAGLAIQTKYTGFIECGAIVAWCALNKRPARGLIVAAIALAVAVGWECWVAHTQGESHFLLQFRLHQDRTVSRAVHIALPLVSQTAALAPGIALLGLAALGWKRRAILTAGLTIVAGLAVLALIPSETPLLTGAAGRAILTPSNLVYAALAVIVWGVLGHICVRLARRKEPDDADYQLTWFVLVWLALELGGYFALSPHPAARRVNGLVLVFTFLAARLAHLEGIRPSVATKVCAFSVAIALLFYVTDCYEARAGQLAAHDVKRRSSELAQEGSVWQMSWWGFEYYAEREGLHPLQLNRQIPRPGDLLAVQDMLAFRKFLAEQRTITLDPVETIVVRDAFPLRTLPGYYAGRNPLEHRTTGRSPVIIYRVTASVPGL
jgi:hypothetical protein